MKHCSVIAILLIASSFSAWSYPEGYPRAGDPFLLAEESDDDIQLGSLRYAARDGGFAVFDEYLLAWRNNHGIEAMIVNANTFEEQVAPFQLVSITVSDPLVSPFGASSRFLDVSDFDVTWSPDKQKYFLVMKLLTETITDPESDPFYSHCVIGTYLDPDHRTSPENWTLIAVAGSSRGVRAIGNPDSASSFDHEIHVFWHDGQPPSNPFTGSSGRILGRLVTGTDAGGKLVFAQPDPVLLMDIKDADAGDDFHLTDMAVEFDNENGYFLLAATVASAIANPDTGEPYLRSEVFARVVRRGLQLPAGNTDPQQYTQISNHGLSRIEDDHKSSENWTVFHPRIIRGRELGGAAGPREWLITFKAVHDIDYGDSVSPTTMHTSWYGRRISYDNTGINLRDTEDVFIGGSQSAGLDRSSKSLLGFDGYGYWHDDLERYLFPWVSGQLSGSPQLNTLGCTAFCDTDAVSAQPLAPFAEILLMSNSGVRDQGIHIIPAISEPRVFALGQDRRHMRVQPIEMRWVDYVLSARMLDAGADETIPLNGERTIEVILRREGIDGVDAFIGEYTGGAVAIRVQAPDGLSVASDDFTDGDAENGFLIEALDLQAGEQRVHEFTVRNVNPVTTELQAGLTLDLVVGKDRFDPTTQDSHEAMTLTLAPNPDGTDPGEPGDEAPGGDDPGDDPVDENPDDGENPGDDEAPDNNETPGEDDGNNDDDNIGGNTGDDGAASGGSGSGGGPVDGLMLALLAAAATRRRNR